jgi:hypothetical protein
MKTRAYVLLSMLVALSAFAEDNAAPLQAKHKSSFELKGDRNPFWPIGWKPSGGGKYGDSAVSDIPETAFVVTSITIENRGRFAIINGKIMQEGQQFGLQMGTSTYQLTVKSIQDGRVILGRHDQEIMVPLRRK